MLIQIAKKDTAIARLESELLALKSEKVNWEKQTVSASMLRERVAGVDESMKLDRENVFAKFDEAIERQQHECLEELRKRYEAEVAEVTRLVVSLQTAGNDSKRHEKEAWRLAASNTKYQTDIHQLQEQSQQLTLKLKHATAKVNEMNKAFNEKYGGANERLVESKKKVQEPEIYSRNKQLDLEMVNRSSEDFESRLSHVNKELDALRSTSISSRQSPGPFSQPMLRTSSEPAALPPPFGYGSRYNSPYSQPSMPISATESRESSSQPITPISEMDSMVPMPESRGLTVEYEFLVAGTPKIGQRISEVSRELTGAVDKMVEGWRKRSRSTWAQPSPAARCVQTRARNVKGAKHEDINDPKTACTNCVEKRLPCVMVYKGYKPAVLPLPVSVRPNGAIPIDLAYYISTERKENLLLLAEGEGIVE